MAKNKTFHKKKTLVVFLGCMLVLTALIGRLVNLMVVQSEYWQKKADDLHEESVRSRPRENEFSMRTELYWQIIKQFVRYP